VHEIETCTDSSILLTLTLKSDTMTYLNHVCHLRCAQNPYEKPDDVSSSLTIKGVMFSEH